MAKNENLAVTILGLSLRGC